MIMLTLQKMGSITFDYGNNIRAVAKDHGEANAFALFAKTNFGLDRKICATVERLRDSPLTSIICMLGTIPKLLLHAQEYFLF